MSELYRSGTGGEADKSAAETRPVTGADQLPARDVADHTQDNAAIEARLDEAGLPTRAEARAAAREPDAADDYDEDDFGPESDAAIEARLDEADLPTRAEARAAARELDAAADDDDYYDDGESFQDLEGAEEWPTQGEQARLHQAYLDWRQEVSASRERGSDVAGDKPDRSQDDVRDLPPTGEQLLEGETGKRSRLDGLRSEWERDEVLDGLHNEAEQDASTVQSILEAHPPEGYPVQVMPDHPNVAPVTPTGIEAGSVAAAGLVVGVVLVETGRRFHDMVRRRRGEGHAR